MVLPLVRCSWGAELWDRRWTRFLRIGRFAIERRFLRSDWLAADISHVIGSQLPPANQIA